MSNIVTSRIADRDKVEQELALNIKKATSADETAPKQKHVRSAIVYTWEFGSSDSIWAGFKGQPLHSDEIQCFKALIAIHKIIKNGHPVALREAIHQTNFLETLGRSVHGEGYKGYGVLIKSYVTFILAKLEYHRLHPDFKGDFAYKDQMSIKETDDPNEGYETIADLLTLQERIDNLQKLIFRSFRPASNNECRISALVPLVEESYGIYQFAMNMLIVMHRRTNSLDALAPLRARFNAQHYALRKFYFECSNLRYLTSLISVPKLPQDPPDLIEKPAASARTAAPQKTPTPPPPAPAEPEPEPMIDFWSEQDQRARQEQYLLEQQLAAQRLQQQREFEEQQQLQLQRERHRLEQLAIEEQQIHYMQNQQQIQQRLIELERELVALRNQHERDQIAVKQYEQRSTALEEQLRKFLASREEQDHAKDELIKTLQAQVALWKGKYQQLAKLYQQLRQDHLDLLSKFNQANQKATRVAQAVTKMEKMQAELKAARDENNDALRERDRARAELENLTSKVTGEADQLRRELAVARARIEDAGRGTHAEKELMEQLVMKKQDRIDEMAAELDSVRSELEHMKADGRSAQSELQERLARALDELEGLRASAQSANGRRDMQGQQLGRLLDSVFRGCAAKIDDAVFELESPAHLGNQNATAEYVLSMIEQGNVVVAEFAEACMSYAEDGDGDSAEQTVENANAFAHAVAQILHNIKGVVRLADDSVVDQIIGAAKLAARTGQQFFGKMQSGQLQSRSLSERLALIENAKRDMLDSLAGTAYVTETLIPRRINDTAMAGKGDDIEDAVEREMMNAARIIEDAVSRLATLAGRPKDPQLTAGDIQVHEAILESAMAMTNAIAHLIKCATDSQQEIVAEGRGTSTKQQFYKRNNRWTEGLISAAKAVALATNMLVEAADGAITGTHSLEQLIVAANEVSAATIQLVAASRVKANYMSKTQVRLELASKAVNDAAKALVKAVMGILESNKNTTMPTGIESGEVKMTPHEFKVKEMNQQVEILKLENELNNARMQLAKLRRLGYHDNEEGG